MTNNSEDSVFTNTTPSRRAIFAKFASRFKRHRSQASSADTPADVTDSDEEGPHGSRDIDPQTSSPLCHLPLELLIEIMSHVAGLHSITTWLEHRRRVGKLDDDALERQQNILTLCGLCKLIPSRFENVNEYNTLFVHNPTDFFQGLQSSLDRSTKNPPSLGGLTHISRIVIVSDSGGMPMQETYRYTNAQSIDNTTARAKRPRTFLTTHYPILPRLRAVVLCPRISVRTSPEFNDRQLAVWTRCVEIGDELQGAEKGLRMQLMTFARDNGGAEYWEFHDPCLDGYWKSPWPNEDARYTDIDSLRINHISEDLHESITMGLPACRVSGSWYVFDSDDKPTREECSTELAQMADHLPEGNEGIRAKWAKVYLPKLTDLATKDDEEAYLREEQTKLDEITRAKGENDMIQLEWMRNAPERKSLAGLLDR